MLALGSLLAFSVVAQPLMIGGTGSGEPLLHRLFEEYKKGMPQASLAFASPPLGSSGGIRAVSTGRIDLAVTSSAPKADQTAQLGRSFKLADTPFVLASMDGQHANGFTLDELANVYAGRKLAWDSGADIRLVLRTVDDIDTRLLASMSPAMAQAIRDANARPGMVIGIDDMETLRLIGQTRGSLGPTNLGLIRSSGMRLVVFPINRVMPSPTTLKNGSYPWLKSLWIVLPAKPTPAALKFAEFLSSDKARAIMLRFDYLPADR